MWKIFIFIEKHLLYPIFFTLCFALYYVFYIIFMFKLPKISYVRAFNDDDKRVEYMSNFAHIITIYATLLGLAAFLAFKFFLK
jgi:hypothetical protein